MAVDLTEHSYTGKKAARKVCSRFSVVTTGLVLGSGQPGRACESSPRWDIHPEASGAFRGSHQAAAAHPANISGT